ncbi:hypothetical protein NZK35_04310 [Stieleria sp. ICT_E10.1]|uniref:hypothetical protein n=1 Tax=Stieleria sedimenti TaxID=2976331 RepID=UPI0021806AFB|nr:hypothetical protein [Stieleria sedimenti]MCS7465895.1 hypothetical protein [Stieleria sedimenti]
MSQSVPETDSFVVNDFGAESLPAATVAEPEIFVAFNGRVLGSDGTDSAEPTGMYFGWLERGEDRPDREFEIYNSGDSDLVLGDVEVPDGFRLVHEGSAWPGANVTQIVRPGHWLSLKIEMLTNQVGAKRGTVTIGSNDSSEPLTSFVIRGDVGSDGAEDSIGLFNQVSSTFELKGSKYDDSIDQSTTFGPGRSTEWLPVTGDWDGDGFDTVGLYNSRTGVFHLKNSIAPGNADHLFAFGPSGNAGWIPMSGDWDGDGVDTVGLYQPGESRFHLIDSLRGGAADHFFAFGPSGATGWIPLAGDWDGDAIDTVGLFRQDGSQFHLKNDLSGGAADHYFAFGPASSDWQPLVGDWYSTGIDKIGLYQPDVSLFHLKDSFSGGAADHYVQYGQPSQYGKLTPLSGEWNGRHNSGSRYPLICFCVTTGPIQTPNIVLLYHGVPFIQETTPATVHSPSDSSDVMSSQALGSDHTSPSARAEFGESESSAGAEAEQGSAGREVLVDQLFTNWSETL